jgi:hypothetical protein
VAYDRSKHIEIIYYYFMDSLRSEIHRPSKPNRRVSLINSDYNNLRHNLDHPSDDDQPVMVMVQGFIETRV